MKSIICGMALAALVSPALADEYWVEYNYTTHTCSVVEKKKGQEPAAGTAQVTTPTDGGMVVWSANTSDATQGAGAADNAATTTQGADGAKTTTADRIRAWMAQRNASGAPKAATTSDATQGAEKITGADLFRSWTAERDAIAERNASGTPNAGTTSVASQGAANTTTEGGASGAPNAATTSVATPGAANTATEGGASGAPNAAATSVATPGAANTTTEGGASGAPNAAATSEAPTSTGTGNNNFDPFKALAASWARKKAAAEAAGTDTTKALIGTAMHSREEAEGEMQVLRQCGLFSH